MRRNARWLLLALVLALVQLGTLCEDPRKNTGLPVSSSPIAVSHDGASVWVVNPDSDTVGKIDTASATLIDEIPVGDNPRTLTHHPGLRWVYVANQGSDSISRINISSGKTKDLDLPHGSAPYGVALTPDSETLLVTLERTHQLAFVDPRTLKVEDVISVPKTPRGIAVTAAGDYAYLSHFITLEPSNSSVVTEIDIAARAVSRSFELPPDFVTCETDASGQGITNLCSTIVLPPPGSPAEFANTV